MRKALIQVDQTAALTRNRQGYIDDTTLKGGVIVPDSTTKVLWSMVPNVNDARVAIWVEDTDNPDLTTQVEKDAMLTEEEAIADGFYIPQTPFNTVLPSLTFTTASIGKAVSCMPGTWTGEPAPTYYYQWQADGADINQAITSVHTVTIADVGKVLTCVVTATNVGGSASAVSNECNAIALKSGKKRKR